MLGQLVPWLSGECYRPVVVLVTDTDLVPVVAMAESLGMRPAVRLREGAWRDGRHHDKIFYEYLNPTWVAQLGDPESLAETSERRPCGDAGEPGAVDRVL